MCNGWQTTACKWAATDRRLPRVGLLAVILSGQEVSGQRPSILRVIAAALLIVWASGLAAAPADRSPAANVIRALSASVEALVASSRPPHWPLRRSCFYYALAGQALLARHGISACLHVGQVSYFPGTAHAHPIAPHAWLATEIGFIDYATLPRWGRVTVIPHALVATDPSLVMPGVTQVLTLSAGPDDPLTWCLQDHYRRFSLFIRAEKERLAAGRRILSHPIAQSLR